MNYFSKVIREIQEKISHRRPTIWTIMLLVGWLFVWLIPWQSWLIENIWLRVIISLIIFNLPGIQLYRLLSKDDPTTLSSIPFGFVFSNLVMSLLGTLGRFAHLPFSLVKNSYMLLGLILLLPIPISKIAQGEEPKIKLPTYRQSINFFLLLAIAILTMLLTIQRTITEDDLTYLALITKFQHAVPLDFTDIFFGSSKIIAPRFWLSCGTQRVTWHLLDRRFLRTIPRSHIDSKPLFSCKIFGPVKPGCSSFNCHSNCISSDVIELSFTWGTIFISTQRGQSNCLIYWISSVYAKRLSVIRKSL